MSAEMPTTIDQHCDMLCEPIKELGLECKVVGTNIEVRSEKEGVNVGEREEEIKTLIEKHCAGLNVLESSKDVVTIGPGA